MVYQYLEITLLVMMWHFGQAAWMSSHPETSTGTIPVSLNETYSNWTAEEPNDFNGNGNKHCIEINSYKSYDWNDCNCDKENYFICEWHSSCNNAAF
jgi:Lectin C-type domain